MYKKINKLRFDSLVSDTLTFRKIAYIQNKTFSRNKSALNNDLRLYALKITNKNIKTL